MPEKIIQLIKNSAGGIDLLTERDAGNTVRILTGKREYSIKYWKRLRDSAIRALREMESSE